jgi:uncharacterized repeat protein (TIGR03847 family)
MSLESPQVAIVDVSFLLGYIRTQPSHVSVAERSYLKGVVMPGEFYEFHPVLRITVGAIGVPGQRTFLLQANDDSKSITLRLEKEQVYALARGIDELLKELERREVRPTSVVEEPPQSDLPLREPYEAAFVVGQMGLAFDQTSDMMVLIAQETSSEDQAEGSAALARFWVGLGQIKALSRLAKEVVAGGRPICPLCQRPIDPGGHFCPRGNGHSQKVPQD